MCVRIPEATSGSTDILRIHKLITYNLIIKLYQNHILNTHRGIHDIILWLPGWLFYWLADYSLIFIGVNINLMYNRKQHKYTHTHTYVSFENKILQEN